MSEHYDVNRGSLVWQVFLKKKSLADIPIIRSIDSPKYSYSIDNPNGIYMMSLKYESKSDIDELIPIILSKLKNKEYEINLGSAICGEFAWRINTKESKIDYNGKSPIDECLYLEFEELENHTSVNAGIAK